MSLFAQLMLGALIGLSTLIFVAYKYMTRNFKYWKNRNVAGPKPSPFFGNFKEISTFKSTIAEGLKNIYDSHDGPYVGIFVFDKPVLLIKSPDLVNAILVKDSALFLNKTFDVAKHNNIERNLLFFQNMPDWKQNRTKMTPAFSPVKLKGMFPLITEVANDFISYVSSKSETIDIKETSSFFFVEAIARCFFGVKSNTFQDTNCKFMEVYRSLFKFSFRNGFVHGSFFFNPEIVRLFKLNFFEEWVSKYLYKIVLEVVNNRERKGTKARDLIDILKEMKETSGKGDTFTQTELEQILANAITFFFAGTETLTSTFSYTCYELAVNPDIQERVREEIMESKAKFGEITYEGTHSMPFTERCLHETIRKYAAVPHLCRRVVDQEYKLPGTELVLEVGSKIYIPLYAIQMDEKNFPNPKKYNPDRFLDPNLNKNGWITYLGFGMGPRQCIGERFALTCMKALLMFILTNFKLERCEKTPDELEFEPRSFVLQAKSGHDLRFVPLVKS
nr:cytochrome P450 [Agasicles hygrophila]